MCLHPCLLPGHGVWLFRQVEAHLGVDASPAAVTALPEPGLALRARRKMLPGPIASGVRWVFSFSVSTLLPRPPHKSRMGRKGQRSLGDSSVLAVRGDQAGFQGQDRDTDDQGSGRGPCCICQPLSSMPGPLKEAEGSSCVMSWQVTCA